MSKETTTSRRKWSLSAKTFLGLTIGILCGVVFGEACAPLNSIGRAFVGLLQMVVLPYIVVSLVASVGRLTSGQARRITLRTVVVVLLLWGIALLAVVMIAGTFPVRQSAAFYNQQLLETPHSLDLVELFIPANPFRSLADNQIPAIVVFCVMLGIALMNSSFKATVLTQLDAWLDVLHRLNGLVVQLTPYGVMAITAHAAGTMTLSELNQLQAYLLSYTAAVVVIGFFVLPALVTACTPFRYRDVLQVTFHAMVTVFATAKLIIVLPLLVENTKELFAKYQRDNEETRADVDMVYPLLYPIPNMGKLLTLAFVPFVGWFVSTPLVTEDFPKLLTLGSVTYFGKPITAMPFLLDTFQLPIDMFQVFVVTGVYCARIGDVLAVMHLFTATVLATCWSQGMLSIRWPRLAARLGGSLVVALLAVVGMRMTLAWSTGEMSSVDSVITQMQSLRHPSPAEVLDGIPSVQDQLPGESALHRVQRTGVLRVGFIQNNLPYSYRNSSGKLVGLDVDIAHLLAEELECRLEFVPFKYDALATHLDASHFDVAMSGIPITTSNLQKVRFSSPYMTASWAIVVPDYRRSEVSTVDKIKQMQSVTIAIPSDAYFYHKTKASFPNATLVQIESPDKFFEAEEGTYDFLLSDAESGSAWTFLHANFQVVVLKPRIIKQPVAYAVQFSDEDTGDFLSHWLQLKSDSGEFKEFYDHWILGRTRVKRTRRWSLLDHLRHSE